MSYYDLLFRGGTVVTAERLVLADVAVVNGRVVAIGSELEGQAAGGRGRLGPASFSWVYRCARSFQRTRTRALGRARVGIAFPGGGWRDNLL